MLVSVGLAWYWAVCRSSVPHLSQDQAIAIARQVATEHHKRLEDYKPPKVDFFAASDQWIIIFSLKTPPTPGKPETLYTLGVRIDDKTGRAEYGEGKLK